MAIIGMHGEAGAERTKVGTYLGVASWPDKVVERLINQIVSQKPVYQYFKSESIKSVTLSSSSDFFRLS